MHVTHLPGEPRVHRLGAPFAQKRSVLDTFGELGLGPYAARASVSQLQVVRHGGRVGRQLEKVKTAVQTRADDATDLVDSRIRVFFPVVVVAVCAAAPTAATVSDDNNAAATATTVTGQRTLVVAPAGVRVATAATSIVATA